MLTLLFCLFFVEAESQFITKNYPVKQTYDTLFTSNSAVLKKHIEFNSEIIEIIGSFTFRSDDFSFYYSSLWDSTTVYLNSNKLVASNLSKEYFPYYQRYLEGYDSVLYINKDNNRYYMVFSIPFFCNGIHCSNISVLFINIDKKECFEIKTYYIDYDLLKKDLLMYIDKKRKFNLKKIINFLIKKRNFVSRGVIFY